MTHGWKPESGFLRYRWEGYCEAMIVYLLGLGSPTHPLPRESWERLDLHLRLANDSTIMSFSMRGRSLLTKSRISGSISAESKMTTCAAKGSDYFENSRRANLCAAGVCNS